MALSSSIQCSLGSESMVEKQRTLPRMFEWTLEHHKQFLDTFILLGGDKENVEVRRALTAELLGLTGCCCGSSYLDFHIYLLGLLQKTSQTLFSSHKVTLDSLYVAPRKMTTPWTLEHHRRVVEAVIQLGGLRSSKTTPTAVLKLMAEKDRQQGLTRKMVRHHLVGLYYIQKETQRLLNLGLAGGEEERKLSLRELQYLVLLLFPQEQNNVLLKQVNKAQRIRLQVIKFEREVLNAFA